MNGELCVSVISLQTLVQVSQSYQSQRKTTRLTHIGLGAVKLSTPYVSVTTYNDILLYNFYKIKNIQVYKMIKWPWIFGLVLVSIVYGLGQLSKFLMNISKKHISAAREIARPENEE